MRHLLSRLVLVSVLAGAGVAAAVVAIAPPLRSLATAGETGSPGVDLDPLPENSRVYAADGSLVAVLHAEENRSPVRLDRVPDTVTGAILAMEDEDFYLHGGVNLRSTLRALFENVSSGEIRQGGSTITQQVVKNSLLSPKRDVNRKLKEAVLAVRLEDQMEKDQILQRYLNTVYFGNGAYGVQAAAEIYFGKDVERLDSGEAALLAGLISNPSRYDPFRAPEQARARRSLALGRMVETQRLTAEEARDLEERPIPDTPHRLLPTPDDYFVEEVKQQLLDDERLGESATERYNAVFKGGLRIHTTFDPRAQRIALAARDDILPDTEGRFTAALVALDPRTGAVRAMIGGPGFQHYKYNLATQGIRQTGSAFKIFVLMAALEAGFVPDDSISGSGPCRFPNPGGTPDPYVAENFGGSGGGSGTITSQTLRSSNSAFLRLGQAVGLDKVVATARRMGITSPLEPVLSLPLGVKEISPLEMAQAAGVIAAGGMRHQPYYIENVQDRDDNVLFTREPSAARVLSGQSTCLATEVLEGNVRSGTGTRARLPGRPAAGKTGTAQRFEDAWFVGFTPQLATAVWMGAPVGKIPMTNVGGVRVAGGTYPARIWGRFMGEVMDGEEVIDFADCPGTRRGTQIRSPNERDPERRRPRFRQTSAPTEEPAEGTSGEPTGEPTTDESQEPDPANRPPDEENSPPAPQQPADDDDD